MGNNIGGANNKTSKVMKINGEYFKIKTPTKVIDIIKDYPDHILLDSQEFLLFNLRAKPLDLDFELKPKKIYLLFELPKFPQNIDITTNSNNIVFDGVKSSPLRRVRSGVLETTTKTTLKETRKSFVSKRSISDLSTMMTNKSRDIETSLGPTRVKVRLPKVQVKRIMEESNDDVEVARRILRLLTAKDGGDNVEEDGGGHGEGRSNVVDVREDDDKEEVEVEMVDKHWYNIHGLCGSHQRKFVKLSP